MLGDVFGLEVGSNHRLTAEAIIDTTVRLVKRSILEHAAATDVEVSRRFWKMTAGDLQHAENRMLLLRRKTANGARCSFSVEQAVEEGPSGMELSMILSVIESGDCNAGV